MFSYHFHIPNYVKNSNGIKIIWEAAYLFSKYRKVSISSFYNGGDQSPVPIKFKNLLKDKYKFNSNDIVVYPDSVHGNPLNANNVCRYLLSKEYILNGIGYGYKDTDFLFAYSNAVSKVLPQYFLLDADLKNIQIYGNRVKKEKGTVSLYFGKCRFFKKSKLRQFLKNFKSVNIITRAHPNTKEELYKVIARSELLISFDPLTSLCMEANLLGTPCLILDDAFKESYDDFNFKLPGFYYACDIRGIDHIIKDSTELKEKINEIIKQQLINKDKYTKEIIKKIEEHCKKIDIKSHIKILNSLKKESNDFYLNKWEMSPLFICTNMTSVWIYLIMSWNYLFFILLKLTHATLKFPLIFKKYFLRFVKFLIYGIFDSNQINLIKYKIRYKRIKNEFISAQQGINALQKIKTTSSESQENVKHVIILSKLKKFIIERF